MIQNLVLVLEERDAEELVLVLCGYYGLVTEQPLLVTYLREATEEQCKCKCMCLCKCERKCKCKFYCKCGGDCVDDGGQWLARDITIISQII